MVSAHDARERSTSKSKAFLADQSYVLIAGLADDTRALDARRPGISRIFTEYIENVPKVQTHRSGEDLDFRPCQGREKRRLRLDTEVTERTTRDAREAHAT